MSAVRSTRSTLPISPGCGAVVVDVSSINGHLPYPDLYSYNASMAAMDSVTVGLAHSPADSCCPRDPAACRVPPDARTGRGTLAGREVGPRWPRAVCPVRPDVSITCAAVRQLPLKSACPGLGPASTHSGRVRSQPMKIISVGIGIGAPPMTVWAVLTDLGRYPEWNPLFREPSGGSPSATGSHCAAPTRPLAA